MGRPIIPQAIRRSTEDSGVEALTKGGQWVPWNLLGDASREAVLIAFAFRMQSGRFPAESFHWAAEAMPEPQQDQDEDHDEREDKPMPQDQPTPEREPQAVTIEDMVRRIAGELDDELVPKIMDQVAVDVADVLAKFYPETSPNVGPNAVTRVEVRTPTVQVDRDGLFHQKFGDLLHLVSIGQHVFLPGPPGSGKSHAAKQVAETIGWHYGELSMSPDLPESRIWGGRTTGTEYVETPLIAGLRHAQANPDQGFVFLFDEMDAGRPGLLVGMNTAAANNRVTAPNGDEITWKDNVVFVGAANTFGTGPTAEFAGRNKLDAATLDRFAYIPWDTDPFMEQAVVRSFLYDDNAGLADAWLDAWATLRGNVANYGLKLFVTMRGAKNGARMLASGMDLERAMMLTIGNKIPADQWSKVNPL